MKLFTTHIFFDTLIYTLLTGTRWAGCTMLSDIVIQLLPLVKTAAENPEFSVRYWLKLLPKYFSVLKYI